MTTSMERTCTYPLELIEKVIGRIDKANKICAKRNSEGFKYEIGTPRSIKDKTSGLNVDVFDLKVAGFMPESTCQVVGIKRTARDGFPVLIGEIPERLRDLEHPHCDMCYTKRNRTSYAVVMVEGVEKVVGSNCLSDLLDNTVIDQFTTIGDLFESLANEEYEEGFGFGSGGMVVDAKRYMAVVYCLATKYGFVTASDCDVSIDIPKIPTWVEAKEAYAGFDLTDDELAKGSLIVSEILACDDSSSYVYNLKKRAGEDFITTKSMSIFASGCKWYLNRRKKSVESSIDLVDGYIGEVKKRDVFVLTYLGSTSYETQWGWTYIHRFRSSEGTSVVWKGSSALHGHFEKTEVCPKDGEFTYKERFLAEAGDVLTVKGTVKSHEVYRNHSGDDIKTTYLTRCALVSFKRDTDDFIPFN